jgi:hypothetical protein
MSFVDGESRRIAVTIPFQTGFVVPLVLGVGQCLGLGGRKFGVVTGLPAVLASGEIALVL